MIPEDIVPLILFSSERAAPQYISETDQKNIILITLQEIRAIPTQRERIIALSWLYQQFLDLEFTIINHYTTFRQSLREKLDEYEAEVIRNEEEYARNFLRLINQVRRKYNL